MAGRRLAITNRAKKLFKKADNDMLMDSKLQDITSDSFPRATLLGMIDFTKVKAHKVPGGTSGSKALYLDSITSKLVSVEELALAHFVSMGWKGVHSENSVMKTLFGLLFWDILFMDLPGVFVSPYQNAPLDLGFCSFFEARREQIENRIEFITNGNAVTLISKVHERESSHGTSCIGIDWCNFTVTDLCEIANCIGPEALSFICNRFAKSYRVYGGGMPDLCLWKSESQEIKFIEVKGPGDRLSEKQILWINDLLNLGISVEILSVQVLNHE